MQGYKPFYAQTTTKLLIMETIKPILRSSKPTKPSYVRKGMWDKQKPVRTYNYALKAIGIGVMVASLVFFYLKHRI